MKIKVCSWKMCSDRFSEYIVTRLKNDIEKFNLKNIEIEETLCMWRCKEGPNMAIENENFSRMNPLKASELLSKKNKNKNANK